MYVIATVFCSNFHFSVSLHVPFSQFLFERDSYSNAYLLPKIGFDTAENERCKVCQKILLNFRPSRGPPPPRASSRLDARWSVPSSVAPSKGVECSAS